MTRDWQPDAEVAVARERAAMMRRIRDYFESTVALEVDTPSLATGATSDPQLESVGAQLAIDPGRPYFLHTSPEFAMKRLLAAGYPDIYQVCKVYRDGEAGRFHQPEFTIIEWYRRYADLERIINDTLALLAAALGRQPLADAAVRISYREAFKAHADCDPLTATVSELMQVADADPALRDAVGEHKDSWLDLILDAHVVPQFAPDTLTVLSHYPASQAALARRNPLQPELADRFEVYLGSFELANGYVELTDGTEQRQRMENDQAVRKQLDRAIRPLDNGFLAAMEYGLPPCSGVAAGLDRMLMIATGKGDIRQITSFAYD